MRTAAQLLPHVRADQHDILVFYVQSRSRQKSEWKVDMEERHGLGTCNCPDHNLNKNGNCWHITQVRKYQSIELNQTVMKQRGTMIRSTPIDRQKEP